MAYDSMSVCGGMCRWSMWVWCMSVCGWVNVGVVCEGCGFVMNGVDAGVLGVVCGAWSVWGCYVGVWVCV